MLPNLFFKPKDRWLPVCEAWEFFHQSVICHQTVALPEFSTRVFFFTNVQSVTREWTHHFKFLLQTSFLNESVTKSYKSFRFPFQREALVKRKICFCRKEFLSRTFAKIEGGDIYACGVIICHYLI